ncbi:MAG: hypothetical protein V4530_16780 [Pseudomonadota bacterium]
MTRTALIAATLIATIAGATPAFAADAARDRFVYDVQAKAAWSGVEVERIVRNADQVTIVGHDRNGRQVWLDTSCNDKNISCPTTAGTGSLLVIAR